MGSGVEFPTGTVTILFSDIQDSTALQEQLRDSYRAILERHNSVMREQLALHKGYEVKTEGDSFMVSFDTAGDAAKFAVAAQLALAKQDWAPSTQPLRVRMGLHSGDVSAVTHPNGMRDYFGQMVNRAARIASSAHGGQIILSRVARDLLGNVPEEWSFKDLGRHQLKGLDALEQLYQLDHIGFSIHEFPPPKTLSGRKHNLPIPVSSFIGREREVKEVRQRLLDPDNRLISLVGWGGTGKTRLSQYVASEVIEQFADGVWLTELADLQNAGQIWPRLLRSLGLPSHPLKEPRDQILGYLADKKLLLLLDNTEQIPGTGDVVMELIKAGPDVKCMVTTRNVLEVPGENVYEVFSMPIPSDCKVASVLSCDSTALFVERARSASNKFQLDEQNAKHVVELVRKLDGLPLAIELVAARMHAGSARQLLERIKRHQKSGDLDGGILDGIDGEGRELRHKKLQNTIDWSFKLLDANHQKLLLHLSTFVGGFTIEAASALCGDPCSCDEFDLDSAIDELRNRSLLTTREIAEETRYGTLDMIRWFCADKLKEQFKEDYVAMLNRQHAEYFLEFAKQLNDQLISESIAWIRLESDLPNLRSAMEWSTATNLHELGSRLALAMCPLLGRRGYWSERKERAETGLESANRAFTAPHEIIAGLLHQIAKSHQDRGEFESAKSIYEQCLAMREALNDKHGAALVLNNLALIANKQGNRTLARELGLKSLELMRRINDKQGQGLVHNTLGSIAFESDDFDEAEKNYEQSRRLRREIDDKQGIAGSANNLANLAERRGDILRAEDLYNECLTQMSALGDPSGRANCLHNLARLARKRKNFEQANKLASESLDIRTELGDKNGIAMSKSLLSNVACEEGKLSDARRLAEDALDVWREVGNGDGILRGQLNLAEILFLMKQYSVAADIYSRAHAEAAKRGSGSSQAVALLGQARCLIADGKPHDAAIYLRRARRLFWRTKDTQNLAETMYELGKLYESSSDPQRCGWCLNVASRLSKTHPDPPAAEASQRFAEFEKRHHDLCLRYDPKASKLDKAGTYR